LSLRGSKGSRSERRKLRAKVMSESLWTRGV
jgi:hypothetical protein